jgi:hypothetical protein
MYTGQGPVLFIRDNSILSSERMFHKDCDRKGLVATKQKTLVASLQGLGAKTNCLAVNRQESNSDSDCSLEVKKAKLSV